MRERIKCEPECYLDSDVYSGDNESWLSVLVSLRKAASSTVSLSSKLGVGKIPLSPFLSNSHLS